MSPSVSGIGGRGRLVAQLQLYGVALYLPLSGIVWVPGVPYELIAAAKILVYGGIVLLALLSPAQPSRDTRAILTPVFACMLAAALSGVIVAGGQGAYAAAGQFIGPLIWLYALSRIPVEQTGPALVLFRRSMWLFLPFILYPAGAALGVLPNLLAPAAFGRPDYESLAFGDTAASVLTGGFAGSRTGWGTAASTAAMMLLALNGASFFRGPRATFLLFLAMVAGVLSIAVTGARGGLMAILAGTILFIVTQWRAPLVAKLCLFGAIGVLVVGAISADSSGAIADKLMRDMGEGHSIGEQVDAISSGRFDTYRLGWDAILASPAFGVGVEGAKLWFDSVVYLQIHNVFLRLLAESGLLMLLPLTLLTARLAIITLARPQGGAAAAAGFGYDFAPVILCGFVVSMVEPAVFFGTMNANLVLWTAIWAQARLRSPHFPPPAPLAPPGVWSALRSATETRKVRPL